MIIPNLRGFGESTHPGDVRSSGTMSDLVGDLVCILQQANVDSVTCIGYDSNTLFIQALICIFFLVTTGAQ